MCGNVTCSDVDEVTLCPYKELLSQGRFLDIVHPNVMVHDDHYEDDTPHQITEHRKLHIIDHLSPSLLNENMISLSFII